MQSNKLQQFALKVRSMAQSQGLSQGEVLTVIENLQKVLKQYDTSYLLSLFFPEFSSPSRVPTKFSQPSALFTNRFFVYVTTGSNGGGAISLLPKDTTGFCLWSWPTNTAYNGNPTGVNLGAQGWLESYQGSQSPFAQSYPAFYSQVRLVGASIRMQYIGNVEQESGFIQGSTVLDSALGQFSDDIINDGYYVTRARPREGIRLVWMPKEDADLDFSDNNWLLGYNSGFVVNGLIPAANLQTNGHSNTVWIDQYLSEGQFAPRVDNAGGYTDYPCNFIGMNGDQSGKNNSPEQLMISWTGLQPNQNWFRVDVERHFEGIPRSVIRDYVATARSSPHEKTLMCARKLAEVSELQSHTMEQLPKLYQTLKTKIMDCDDLISRLDESQSVGNTGMNSLLTKNNNSLQWLYEDNATSGAGSSLNSGMIGGDQFNQRIGQGYEMYLPGSNQNISSL